MDNVVKLPKPTVDPRLLDFLIFKGHLQPHQRHDWEAMQMTKSWEELRKLAKEIIDAEFDRLIEELWSDETCEIFRTIVVLPDGRPVLRKILKDH